MAIRPKNTGAIKIDEIGEKTASNEIKVIDKLVFQNASDGIVDTVETAIDASGTTQGTARTLTYIVNVVATATQDAQDGVILGTSFSIGQQVHVINATNSPIKVYPPSGGSISWKSADTPYILDVHNSLTLIKVSATSWRLI